MWLRRLQLWHITALVVTPISVAVFRVVTDSDDRWRIRLEGGTVIVASIWSAMLLVELVVRGESEGTAKDRLVAAYRRLLTRTSFLLEIPRLRYSPGLAPTTRLNALLNAASDS
jgi:hypothetical protein